MFEAFWMGIPSCVSRRATPGLETRAILNGPSHMGESFCSPYLKNTRLRTRLPTSNVLKQMLRQRYHRSACLYLAARSEA